MARKRVNAWVQVNSSADRGLEKALRALKKKLDREGILRDIKKRQYHEPAPQKRRKRLVRAIKNTLLMRQQLTPTRRSRH